MRRGPDYGVYLWWPDDRREWIHPEDVELVEQLIPSNRVFRRGPLVGRYQQLRYGDLRVRIQPILYEPLDGEGFDVGDHVEVRSRMGKNRAFVGVIREMRWDPVHRRIRYYVRRRGRDIPRGYAADDLQTLERKEQLRPRWEAS